MRIWTVHPKYLDAKGLVALWRETLLAKQVLEGRTKGYKNHPQLYRFKASDDPLLNIHYYLSEVYNEAVARGYNFDKSKFDCVDMKKTLSCTKGQLEYESHHLLNKLKVRDPESFKRVSAEPTLHPHPLFHIVPGAIEPWEIIS